MLESWRPLGYLEEWTSCVSGPLGYLVTELETSRVSCDEYDF